MDEEILNNIDNNTESSEVSATTEESVVDNQSAEDSNVAEVAESPEMNGDKKVVTEKTNPSQFTHEEQMTYSFKRQLAKQRSKYEKQIADLQKQWEERFDKLENPAKYAPKTRKDFEYDDDYVKYLANEQVNAALEAKIAEYQKQHEEEQRQAQVDEEYRTILDKTVKSIYNTPEAEADWRAKVGEGMKAGLGSLIDGDQDLSNYIIFSPIGPKIMYELASNKKTVQDIFTIGITPDGHVIPRSPGDRMRKMEELAERLSRTDINNNRTNVQPVKPIGRPGINKEVKKDIFSDPKALLDMMY
ncbi:MULTISPECIES: hypothetical protein [Bacteria]|uniref:hypothetical protein n=1 Tax=Bacteria TaxID=2 RepID=UPI000AEAA3DD|nr:MULTISPECIES: hypothetical protein [Bacteria]